MYVSTLLSLVMVGATLSAPLPKVCKPNVVTKGPSAINAGCKMRLQLTFPAHSLSAVSTLNVRFYQENSRHGTLVHQVKAKEVKSDQATIEAMFPVGGNYLGNGTLIVTEAASRNIKCPAIYGIHELSILPSIPDVMCTF
ncbi:hypothetical protein K493DRAFT_312248 [Basidiobolus meristosporus CBS 931.73]|uniref:MD-2-related lipid-recognition domain-containing protein n=1 Tax=Basidiobolus meristosporus CBS 931.73 TaxID=1314790 RepID=A0A1Y1YVI5_9FUNG|nr:hypothetical protein K493DRAFT_312248 [Basidiobolus meristosporus CBS 931.73]|eukprot:ORY01854.1 hypothetical protein K493DRAFT_312248 [Basidiobolus meristosporus CBS 931.73]